MGPMTLNPVSNSTTAQDLLVATALACRRGRRLLFSGLELLLPANSITWLRGANGSGKTSLLRILAGLSHPAQGKVEHAAPLLYIGHANALKDDLTLFEALSFLGRLQGVEDVALRCDSALALLGLSSRRDALVRTLSQGQRRRGALARLALSPARQAWLLDEPYDALDQASVAVLDRLIERHAESGGAVLLTSHQSVALAGMRVFDLDTEPRS
jgi:heme exporter protein A